MTDSNERVDQSVVDVIVVGGGIAGLTAGFWLNEFTKMNGGEGKRFVILEGRNAIGGRTETADGREDIDLGAAYFGPLQSYTMRLAERLMVERIDNELPLNIDHRTEWSDGSILKFRDKSFGVPPGVVSSTATQMLSCFGLLSGFYNTCEQDAEAELFARIGELEALTLGLRNHLHDPGASIAAELDAISVEDWIQSKIQSRSVQDLLRVGVRAALSAEPSELSMLYLLFYTATGGSFVNVMAVGGGADSFRFKSGTADLITRLINEVGRNNIKTNARVVRIEEERGRVVAVTSDGRRFIGQRCIVAMSPTQMVRRTGGGVEHLVPSAPQATKDLATTMRMGRTIKAFLTFKNPWWRAIGSSGYALSAMGPVVWTMDNTWPAHGAEGARYSLMAFIVGTSADDLARKTSAERLDAIIGHWSRIFEIDAAIIRNQLAVGEHYHERVWASGSWSGGCPAAFFPPNTFRDLSPHLRAPLGRIHWAGAETGTDWVGGYMNGAIQSGIRAAEEVLKGLPQSSATDP